MLSIPFTHGGEKVVAIADITSDSAGACIALVRNGAPAEILCAERSTLTYDEKTPEQTEAGVLALLEDAITKVTRVYSKLPNKSRPHAISSVHAIIHAPFSSSLTARAAAAYKEEQLITKEIIGNLSQSSLSALESEKKIDKARLFEAGVASIELNGYRTGHPNGKNAHTVAVATLLSECNPECRTKIIDALRKGFGVQNPVLHSDTRAILHSTHMNPVQANRHFIIDVSGDSTNCVVIHKDTAAEHFVVPEGTRTILKRIAGGGMAEETLSLIRMVARDSCNTPDCEKLNTSLARVETELVKVFGETFNRLMMARRLPNDLVLIVSADFAPWMINLFSRIDFGQFTVSARQFAVHTFTEDDMRDFVVGHSGPKVDTWHSLGAILASAEEQSTG